MAGRRQQHRHWHGEAQDVMKGHWLSVMQAFWRPQAVEHYETIQVCPKDLSIPRNAIADGANSAATCASAQGNQLGIGNKEAPTPTNGAHAYSLAYE
jgi:hypothetical protein